MTDSYQITLEIEAKDEYPTLDGTWEAGRLPLEHGEVARLLEDTIRDHAENAEGFPWKVRRVTE